MAGVPLEYPFRGPCTIAADVTPVPGACISGRNSMPYPGADKLLRQMVRGCICADRSAGPQKDGRLRTVLATTTDHRSCNGCGPFHRGREHQFPNELDHPPSFSAGPEDQRFRTGWFSCLLLPLTRSRGGTTEHVRWSASTPIPYTISHRDRSKVGRLR